MEHSIIHNEMSTKEVDKTFTQFLVLIHQYQQATQDGNVTQIADIFQKIIDMLATHTGDVRQ